MASSSSFTNEEIKPRVKNIYAQFVSDADPDRLSDWLIQANVVTFDQWQRIRLENPVTRDRCRALLDRLFSIQHPRAFLVLRQALEKENHHLLESIDKQTPGCGICEQPGTQNVLQGELLETKIPEFAKSSDDQKRKIDKLEKKNKILEEEKRKLEEQNSKWEEEKFTLKEDILKLEEQKRKWEEEKRKLEEENSKREEEKFTLKEEILKLEEQKRKWEKVKRELEERLYPSGNASYSDKPKLVSVIDIKTLKADSKKEMRPIFGMTILRNKLFVVTEKSSEIEVYDSITFNSEPRWQIAEMFNPRDIASCRTTDCLYVFNGKPSGEILRVDASKILLNKWSIEEDSGHLSVTREGNVVVSLFNAKKNIEYSPAGQLIKTFTLSSADKTSHPWHAVKLTGNHILFSHGTEGDPLQGISVANAEGKLLKSFRVRKGIYIVSQLMSLSIHLLEDSSRNVLVADMTNGRVLLYSPALEYKRILVSADQSRSKLRLPTRLCLDEERGILFVADNNFKEGVCTLYDGRILIFNCKT